MVRGSLVLTYNGEIYNHEQLRRPLHGPWHSTGDTETLLRLLADQGSAALEDLAERLERFPIRLTQLAHGLPVGGELDYLDEGTLAAALRSRTAF